ncbi:DUF6371 domain-containing protein [Spirosoma foliorum]|uniref:Uncharacterized protein n=1 Tax=Spirosoma foliorum TaxID=2710596 RepID=A0A7G5GUD5_9BACT|nr:DUF6371 domain-containing protein [Spirosoma foliorum]QMW02477.1 hypothetical protein H3H32_31975 [Spirosoma foliorum]
MVTSALRYQLPKKAVKSDCPDCGPKHRRTLSRYVDTRTNEPLPEPYGRCDRESNCGYHLSPYYKGASGISYADHVYEQWKVDNSTDLRPVGSSISKYRAHSMNNPQPKVAPIHCIPNDVFASTVGLYERNQLAILLQEHFGAKVSQELLSRFQIGTSAYWPGACVFWLKDERGRIRGGQVVLFDSTGHTAKRTGPDGKSKRCTSWVHTALATRYDQNKLPRPAWLTDYIDNANKFPIPFGLNQLLMAEKGQAVAIVESPKTAIICTPYFPEFIWMAIGGLSYLNSERLSPLRARKLVLFPDASAEGRAFEQWWNRAEQLRGQGFSVTVSDYLEKLATDEEKLAGLDLADYLLEQWKGYPPDWDTTEKGVDQSTGSAQ